MAVLVTGGAGFIGSHTCVELLGAGEEVVIIDNFSNSKPQVLDKIREITGKDFKFYEVDLLDEQGVKRVFDENPDIDSVIHFAALKAVGESVQKPLEYYHNNLTGTLVLCKQMRTTTLKRSFSPLLLPFTVLPLLCPSVKTSRFRQPTPMVLPS